MQRWSYLVVVAVFAAACPPLSELKCDSSSPCPSGASCNADGYCVEQGTGGGSGGGGGGGTGGGMGTCAPCGDAGNEFQVCVGGACVAKYQKLEWEVPVEGSFTADASVALRAKLTVGAASVMPWPTVAVKFEKGGTAGPVATLNYANGFYEGAQVLADGVWKATVSSPGDAGLTAVSNFTVDTVAPVLTVTVPPAPYSNDGGVVSHDDPNFPGAWKRDDKVVVKVSSNESLNSVTVDVEGIQRPDSGTPQVLAALAVICTDKGVTGCDSATCKCVEVDLAAPVMDAFSGEFKLRAHGADEAGNAATKEGAVRVTRHRWTRNSNEQMKATPAIGSVGTIYLATTGSNRVVAINPDGGMAWQTQDIGSMEGSPIAVALPGLPADVVFFASLVGGEARVGALTGSDGGTYSASAPHCANVGASVAPPSPTLIFSDAGVAAVTVAHDRLCAMTIGSVGDAATARTVPGLPLSAVISGNLSNLVSVKNRVMYGDENGNVVAYTLNSLSSWSTQDWQASLASSGTPQGLAVQRATSGDVKIVGGGAGSPGVGQLFQINVDGGSVDWRYPSTAPMSAVWTPSIDDASHIYFGMDAVSGGPGKSLRMSSQTAISAAYVEMGSSVKTGPLLGDDDRVYALSSSGILGAYSAKELLSAWSFNVAEAVASSPALDCNRAHLGGPGVMYLAASSGKLHAILVDARKLKPDAAWPKYQHDSANSGNPDWPLNPGCP